ncbi:MAG: hypothetical protein ACT4QF_09840 [Sporichthyaceae bacterium]
MNTTLMWIANAVLFFVVLPVVIALLNRLLIPVIRIRRAAESILDGGVHLMNQVDPVPGLLGRTGTAVSAVAQGALRYAGSVNKLLPAKEPASAPTAPAEAEATGKHRVATEV